MDESTRGVRRADRPNRTTLIAAVFAVACGAADQAVTAPRQRAPSIAVNVAVVGNGADSDGFVVRVGGRSLSFRGADTQIDSTLSRGPYSVELSGLAGNCAADTTSAFVDVTDTTHATVHLTVECYGGFGYTAIDASDHWTVFYLDETGHTSRLFNGPDFAGVIDWSPDGAYALIRRVDLQGKGTFWVVARDGGSSRQLSTPDAQTTAASFAPDGSHILYTQFGHGTHLRVTDVQGTFDRPVFADSSTSLNAFGSWSPDGNHIAYVSNQFGGLLKIAAVHADGSGPVPLSTQSFSFAGTTGWSPDGQYIAAEVATSSAPSTPYIALMPAAGGPLVETLPNPLLFLNASDFSWAADGTQLAMTRLDSDAPRVVIVKRDGSQPFVLAPNLLYSEVANWSNDGARILFLGALASTNGQQWIFVARPDGTHVHPVVEGAMLSPNYPVWNRAARPGINDR